MRLHRSSAREDRQGKDVSRLIAELEAILLPGWDVLRARILTDFEEDRRSRAAAPGVTPSAAARAALTSLGATCNHDGVKEVLKQIRITLPQAFRGAASLRVEAELEAALSRRIEEVLAATHAEGLRRCRDVIGE